MSRQHGSFYTAAALLERHGREVIRGRGGRHSAKAVETELAGETRVLPAIGPEDDEVDALDELHKDMVYVGADVRWVEREPNGDCPRCDREGALAEITVYTDGDVEEMCRECTPTYVVSEISAGQHRRPVVVEIPAVSA